MATGGYLEGILDGIRYRISDEDGFGRLFEEKLKTTIKITEGEFYFFYCEDDETSNRFRSLKELSDALKKERQSRPGKYIVQIVSEEQNNDFGYAILKLFENIPDLTRSTIKIEKGQVKTQIYVKNQGVDYLIESSDAFDFYKRIILSLKNNH